MPTWEEVKRLAADFKAVQLGSVSQKLSERNCIEIVQSLKSLGLLEVFYTLDAKYYLTPEEIRKEIHEELDAQNGRVNLVNLQQTINVDFNVIDKMVNDMVKFDSHNLLLITGQLIHVSYMRHLATEVRDMLQQTGHLAIGQLTTRFELPTAFLQQELIGAYLNSIIQARQDGDIIYTEEYVRRKKAMIRGYLAAATKPINLNTTLAFVSMPEKMFFNLVEEILYEDKKKNANQLSVCGSLESGKTVFVPQIFTNAQIQWIENFFLQNSFINFDDMRRLGIANPSQFCLKYLTEQSSSSSSSPSSTAVPPIILKNSCIHSSIPGEIRVHIDECIKQGSWIDLTTFLPTSLSQDDISALVKPLIKSFHGVKFLCENSIAITETCLNQLKLQLQSLMAERAERIAKEQPKLVSTFREIQNKQAKNHSTTFKTMEFNDEFDDDHSKSTGGKGGGGKNKGGSKTSGGGGGGGGGGSGGSQRAREVKLKANKNKYVTSNKKGVGDGEHHVGDNANHQAANDSANVNNIIFMEPSEFQQHLQQHFGSEASEEMYEELINELLPLLQKEFQLVLQSVFLQTSGSGKNRSCLQENKEKLSNMLSGIQLYDKACEIIGKNDANLQTALRKHVLRTDCTDLFLLLVKIMIQEYDLEWDEETKALSSSSHEQRAKLLQPLPSDIQPLAQSINNCLRADKDNLQDYYTLVTDLSNKLGILLRVNDKKREKIQSSEIAAQLSQMLPSDANAEQHVTNTPEMAANNLLITCRLLCQGATGFPLNAPGRLVPKLITWLQPHLKEADVSLLKECEQVVISWTKASNASGEGDESKEQWLNLWLELAPKLYSLAALWKKMPFKQNSNDG